MINTNIYINILNYFYIRRPHRRMGYIGCESPLGPPLWSPPWRTVFVSYFAENPAARCIPLYLPVAR